MDKWIRQRTGLDTQCPLRLVSYPFILSAGQEQESLAEGCGLEPSDTIFVCPINFQLFQTVLQTLLTIPALIKCKIFTYLHLPSANNDYICTQKEMNTSDVLYVNADDIYFSNHRLLDLAEKLVQLGLNY